MATNLDNTLNVDNLPTDMQSLQKLMSRMETEMAELESRLDELTIDNAAAEAFDQFEHTWTAVTPARTVGLLNMLA